MSNNNQANAPKKYNFCTSQLKTTTEKFIWTIDNFSKREKKTGEFLESADFSSTAPDGQHLKWRLRMYPNGVKEEGKDFVALFLSYLNDNDDDDEKVEAKYQISIRHSNGYEFNVKSLDKFCIKFPGSTWLGNYKLIKREGLFNEEYEFLNGDRLTIVCNLIIHQESVETAPLTDVEVPECRGMEDLSNLFEQSLFTDSIIISEDEKKYKVHKCILGCRSPVFAAMFEHEMLEKNSNIINIEDIKGNVIEKMLRFIYSGKEPDMEEKMAEELLVAADKYELTRLKLICERKLINSLGNENACGSLLLADLHSAKLLKAHAINFIKLHLNEIMGTEGWEEILADKQLVEQIMKTMAK